MKKVLIVLGVVALILAVVAGIGVANFCTGLAHAPC